MVGDDDQSIYGFRGSMPAIMKRFESDFDNTIKYNLFENYRSGSQIIDFANKVIINNKERYSKDFKAKRECIGKLSIIIKESRSEEEKAIVDILKALSNEELTNTAIITRTNREAMLYEKLLSDNHILCSASKRNESTNNRQLHEVFDDICAFYNYVYVKHKRSDFIRFMNKPERYIQRSLLSEEIISEANLLNNYYRNPTMHQNISSLFRLLKVAEGLTPEICFDFFLNALGYMKYIKDQYKDNKDYSDIIQMINRLKIYISNYDNDVSFTKHLNIFKPENNIDCSKDLPNKGVNILTMHASKGLEFDTVLLPDINEGVIPPKQCSNDNLEEERRLLYVAITRARNNLYILTANERNRDVSRFIRDII